jgi:hypothetical protein
MELEFGMQTPGGGPREGGTGYRTFAGFEASVDWMAAAIDAWTGFAPAGPRPLDGPHAIATRNTRVCQPNASGVSAFLSSMRDLRAIRGFVSELTLARGNRGRKKNV